MNKHELPEIEYWSYWDWDEVLGKPAEYAAKGGEAPLVTAERITDVVWLTADSPEGYGSVDAAMIIRLDDGAYAMCEAWADTTGWGCRDGVTWKIGNSIAEAVSELSLENRALYEAWVANPDG